MNVIDKISWMDIAVQMQLSTMEMGRVRVIVSTELVLHGRND
jgi:hypothetical protein